MGLRTWAADALMLVLWLCWMKILVMSTRRRAWAADAHDARPLGFVGSWVGACAVDTHDARPLGLI